MLGKFLDRIPSKVFTKIHEQKNITLFGYNLRGNPSDIEVCALVG